MITYVQFVIFNRLDVELSSNNITEANYKIFDMLAEVGIGLQRTVSSFNFVELEMAMRSIAKHVERASVDNVIAAEIIDHKSNCNEINKEYNSQFMLTAHEEEIVIVDDFAMEGPSTTSRAIDDSVEGMEAKINSDAQAVTKRTGRRRKAIRRFFRFFTCCVK